MLFEDDEGVVDGLNAVSLASVAASDGGGRALAGALVAERLSLAGRPAARGSRGVGHGAEHD